MEMITIPRAEYDALVSAREALEDVLALDRGLAEEQLPAAFVDRMLAGENLIRLWREHRGLTRVQLAEKAGMHRVNLVKIEGGARGASVPTLMKLAAALGVTVDDLV
jgi:DNA-binding XRE family transcriptional regulator